MTINQYCREWVRYNSCNPIKIVFGDPVHFLLIQNLKNDIMFNRRYSLIELVGINQWVRGWIKRGPHKTVMIRDQHSRNIGKSFSIHNHDRSNDCSKCSVALFCFFFLLFSSSISIIPFSRRSDQDQNRSMFTIKVDAIKPWTIDIVNINREPLIYYD